MENGNNFSHFIRIRMAVW